MTVAQLSTSTGTVVRGVAPFALLHALSLAAIWTGVSGRDLTLFAVLYLVRLWGVTAGYHRYFSHRAFHTTRAFQLFLALLAQSTAQKGALWWASVHRWHHAHADTAEDIHSPHSQGFWFAHIGWMFQRENYETEYPRVRDFARFPELVWLDRHPYYIPAALGTLVFLVGGFSGFVVGFCWSTVLIYHAIFLVNSLGHSLEPAAGSRDFETRDHSRNLWLLSLLTLGEGWHNNHHWAPSSARHGFRWWQLDPTWYSLKLLAALGVVWDLKGRRELR